LTSFSFPDSARDERSRCLRGGNSFGDSFKLDTQRRGSFRVKLLLQATTGIPNARARGIISWPILPTPINPSVRPNRPRAFENSFLFHSPRRNATTLSAMRRSSARMSANASSATAIEFLPGQFET
jgi:hypothetical protein